MTFGVSSHPRFLPTLLIWWACIASFALPSCSGSSGPSLADIPADADYVAILRLDSLAQAEEAMQFLNIGAPERLATLTAGIASALDLSQVIVYKPVETGMGIMAAGITDGSALKSALSEAGWVKRKFRSEEIYEPESAGEFGCCMVMDGATAWFLANRTDLKAWRESLHKAGKSSYATLPLDRLVEERGVILALVNPATLGLNAPDRLFAVTSSSTADALTLRGGMIDVAKDSKGHYVPLDLLSPIGTIPTELRDMICAGPSLTILAGMSQSIDWANIVEMAGPGLGTQNQGMFQSLLPYIKSLNGVFALNAGPLTAASLDDGDPEHQSLLVYGRLEGNRANEAVEEINSNLRAKGLNPVPRADGIYAFSLGDARYRYTARDGAFIFALNREINLPAGQALPAIILPDDSRLSATLSLPPVTGAPAPLVTMTMDRNAITFTITDKGGNPLSALATYFTTLHRQSQTARETSDSYYDEYD